MEQCLSLREKMLVRLYRQGVKGLREKLVLSLPRDTEEWSDLVRDVLSDDDPALRAEIVRQLLEPGFVEHHPHSEKLVDAIQDLMTDGDHREKCAVTRFAAENLRLFPVQRDSFQLKVMTLQISGDPRTAVAAEELLEKMGIDLRDPTLLGDSHDSAQI